VDSSTIRSSLTSLHLFVYSSNALVLLVATPYSARATLYMMAVSFVFKILLFFLSFSNLTTASPWGIFGGKGNWGNSGWGETTTTAAEETQSSWGKPAPIYSTSSWTSAPGQGWNKPSSMSQPTQSMTTEIVTRTYTTTSSCSTSSSMTTKTWVSSWMTTRPVASTKPFVNSSKTTNTQSIPTIISTSSIVTTQSSSTIVLPPGTTKIPMSSVCTAETSVTTVYASEKTLTVSIIFISSVTKPRLLCLFMRQILLSRLY
jgi:hypothetical protein